MKGLLGGDLKYFATYISQCSTEFDSKISYIMFYGKDPRIKVKLVRPIISTCQISSRQLIIITFINNCNIMVGEKKWYGCQSHTFHTGAYATEITKSQM